MASKRELEGTIADLEGTVARLAADLTATTAELVLTQEKLADRKAALINVSKDRDKYKTDLDDLLKKIREALNPPITYGNAFINIAPSGGGLNSIPALIGQ